MHITFAVSDYHLLHWYIGNVETDECSIRTPLQLDKTITEYDLVDSITKNVGELESVDILRWGYLNSLYTFVRTNLTWAQCQVGVIITTTWQEGQVTIQMDLDIIMEQEEATLFRKNRTKYY